MCVVYRYAERQNQVTKQTYEVASLQQSLQRTQQEVNTANIFLCML